MGRNPLDSELPCCLHLPQAGPWGGGRGLRVQTEGNLQDLSPLSSFSSILPRGGSGALGHGWGWGGSVGAADWVPTEGPIKLRLVQGNGDIPLEAPGWGGGGPEDFLEDEGSTLDTRELVRTHWGTEEASGLLTWGLVTAFEAGGEGLSVEGQRPQRLGYPSRVGVQLSLWVGSKHEAEVEECAQLWRALPLASCCLLQALRVGG